MDPAVLAAMIGTGGNFVGNLLGGSGFPSQYKRDQLMADQKHMMDYQGQKALELFNHSSYWGRVQQDQNFTQALGHEGQRFDQQLAQEQKRNATLFPDATQFELLGAGGMSGAAGGSVNVGNVEGDAMKAQAQQQQAVQMAQIEAQKEIAQMSGFKDIATAKINAQASNYAADAAQPLGRRVLDGVEEYLDKQGVSNPVGAAADALQEGINNGKGIGNAIKQGWQEWAAGIGKKAGDWLDSKIRSNSGSFSSTLEGNLGAGSDTPTPFEQDEIRLIEMEKAQSDLKRRQKQLDLHSYGRGRS